MFPDVSGLIKAGADIQVYTATNVIHQWTRPRGKSMLYAMAIGGGGGGGGGNTAAVGNVRVGGGGGGSGAMAKIIIPMFCIPETLYISIGPGGAGNAATIAGSNGDNTRIAVLNNVAFNQDILLLITGSTSARGGATGTGTPGAGGAGEVAAGVAQCKYSFGGISQFLVGDTGASGGANTGAAGVARTILTSNLTSGGGGGGTTPAANSEFAGGAVSGTSNGIPSLAGGTGGGNPGNGYAGWDTILNGIFVPYGGSGGGTGGAALTVGGDGGAGAVGCGGGGGGGGVTGGRGGRGGDGMAIIVSW